MKIRKRFIAIIILAMAIGLINLMPIPESKATITEDTNTGSITITGLEAGVTVYAYQFITVNYDYDADQPSDPEYTFSEWIQSYAEACWVGEYCDEDYNLYDSYQDLSNDELRNMLGESASLASNFTERTCEMQVRRNSHLPGVRRRLYGNCHNGGNGNGIIHDIR